MRKLAAFALFLASTISTAIPALSQSLKEREGIETDKETILLDEKSMNKTCDSHIKLSVDYASYKGAGGVDEDHNAPWKDSRNASSTVEQICGESDIVKTTVQSKIDSIVCGWSAKEEISLQGKTLHYSTPYGQGNPVHVKDFLEKNL